MYQSLNNVMPVVEVARPKYVPWRKCKTALRLTCLWFIVIGIATGAGLSLGLGVFGKTSRQAMPTDMREIRGGLSTVFCSGVTVYSWYWDVDVYMLPHTPRVDHDNRHIYMSQFASTVVERYYQTYQYYLLEGSSVSLNSSCETPLEMYVFQGQRNYEKFMDNEYCDKCYIHHENLTGFSSYELNYTNTDDYYFMYQNRNIYHSQNLYVNFYLNRTLYDVGSVIPCLYSWPRKCQFDFDVGSHQSIVFQVNDGQENIQATVKSRCKPRVWLYVLLFAVPALVLVCGCCALICRIHKSHYHVSDRQPLTGSPDVCISSSANVNHVQTYPPNLHSPPMYHAAVANEHGVQIPSCQASKTEVLSTY